MFESVGIEIPTYYITVGYRRTTMINLTHEEAQQVLDALKNSRATGRLDDQAWGLATQAIETLRARLSEPEPQQDWMERERAVGYREGHQAALKQRKWVGLTTDEVFELSSTRLPHGLFAGLIEAKLKEKNT